MSSLNAESARVMRSWYRDAMHRPFSLTHGTDHDTGALLVHGFTGSPADLRSLADSIHPLGIDVHAMVLPGMAAEIDRLNEMTAEIWRDAVREEWRRIRARYERTVLIGYSMGGALSILAALEHPPDLLVLIAPLSRLADRRAPFLPVAKYIVPHVRPYAGLNWSDERVHAWFDRTRPSMQTRDPMNQQVLVNDAVYSTRMLDQLRRLLAQVRRAAPQVTAPALVVQGTDDRLVLPRDTRRLVARLGGEVDYREIPGDHYLPLRAMAAWAPFRDIVLGSLRTWMAGA